MLFRSCFYTCLYFLLSVLLVHTASAETVVYGAQFQGNPIRVVGDKDYPPIEWVENYQVRGIYSDFLAGLSKKIERPIEYSLMEWDQAQKNVLVGKADLLTVFSPNHEREKNYSFIEGFIKLDISIFTKEENYNVSHVSDLDSYTVGVIKGSYPASIINSHTSAKVSTVSNHLEGFEKIKNGALDALVTTKWVGAYVLNKEGIEGIKILREPLLTKVTHIAAKKGNEELLKIVQSGIADMKSVGEIRQVKAKWSDYYMVYFTEKEVKNVLLLGSVAFMICLIAFLLFLVISLNRKITERKERDRLEYLADFDEVTGLPNKRSLLKALDSAFSQIGRKPHINLAVLTIDLDNFKRINDSLGASIGDSVIKIIAERMLKTIRDVDALFKITGDKFIVVLQPDEAVSASAIQLAFRTLNNVAKKLNIGNSELHCTASVGIALAPQDGVEPAELLQNAEVAVNYAKKNGGNNFQFYESALTQRAIARINMENQLNAAIEHNDFLLFYQPQYDATTKEIKSVEALIRWKGKNDEYICPTDFIPVAEETGQISAIDSWVLSNACKQLSIWRKKGLSIKLSVNVSAIKLQSNTFVNEVETCLHQHQIPPQYLTIEITETALMKNEKKSFLCIQELKKLGVGISLDDFGTGYSSLSLLKKLSADELKIDRGFVNGLPDDQDDKSICLSLIAVAHNLGIYVVAEGVEEVEQVNLLSELGCDYLQGYYFSPAVSPYELEQLTFENLNTTKQV